MDANSINKHEIQSMWSQSDDNRYQTSLQQLSPQVSNPKALTQRLEENHLYLIT